MHYFFFFFFFFPGRDQYYRRLFLGLFCGFLFREHPKAQPGGGFRRSPGSNLRSLVYKASDLTTAPRRLLLFFPFTPLIELFGIYKMFKMLNH